MSRPPSGRGLAVTDGAVGVGDGADDGQAESVSFAVADPLGAELPERLEQVIDRVRRDEGAGVADRYDGARGGHGGCDVRVAAGQVVPDGVVDEVGDQAFGQARVACRRGRGELGGEADAVALGIAASGQEHIAGDVGEVKGLRVLDPALAVGQGEQGRDEALLPVAQLHELLAG